MVGVLAFSWLSGRQWVSWLSFGFPEVDMVGVLAFLAFPHMVGVLAFLAFSWLSLVGVLAFPWLSFSWLSLVGVLAFLL
jgi:hypothetical protein